MSAFHVALCSICLSSKGALFCNMSCPPWMFCFPYVCPSRVCCFHDVCLGVLFSVGPSHWHVFYSVCLSSQRFFCFQYDCSIRIVLLSLCPSYHRFVVFSVSVFRKCVLSSMSILSGCHVFRISALPGSVVVSTSKSSYRVGCFQYTR
jgi:hypothetical protein